MKLLQILFDYFAREDLISEEQTPMRNKGKITVFIHIKAGLKYTQGLKYTLGSAAEWKK